MLWAKANGAWEYSQAWMLTELPLHPDDLKEHGSSVQATVDEMIQRTVERMYSETEENRFLEVTYANGDKEVLYFKDFNSGAMIENIVARAKKMAIKEFLDTGQKGIRVAHLLAACVDEFSENEDLPNTTNPDDWARISGKKGERIVYIRTLVSGKQGTEAGRSIDTVANTGQYLCTTRPTHEVAMLVEVLVVVKHALVISHAADERIVRLAAPLLDQVLRGGDSLLLEPRSGHVYERIPKAEVEELFLEELPDIAYTVVTGGLSSQIEQIRSAIGLPCLHAHLFREHQLRPPGLSWLTSGMCSIDGVYMPSGVPT